MKNLRRLLGLFLLSIGINAVAQTSTTTNYAVGTGIPDNDATGLASTRTFSTPIVSLSDLNVTLNIAGTFNGDLYAYVTHSSGFTVLLNRVGRRAADLMGYGDDGFDVTFDDEATNGNVHIYRLTLNASHATPLAGALTNSWVPDGRTNDPAVVLDTDTPASALSSFDGLNPNGSWTLFVADLQAGDVSTLVSWGLAATGFLPPAIVLQPQDQIVCPGGTAVFGVTASGTPPFSYQWRKGGVNLTDETNATLTILNAQTANAGSYDVTVSDTHGAVTSAVATLTLRSADVFANTAAITINDNSAASPYPSTINVSGLTATVCRVTVTLSNINHIFPDDIDIVLQAPNGDTVLLMSDVGNGNSLSGVTLTLDDAAASSMPDAGAIVSGTYKPTNIGSKDDGRPDNFPAPVPVVRHPTNFAGLSGIDPNGPWSLYVVDDEAVDVGSIANGWSIAITTVTPFADVAIVQAGAPNPAILCSNFTFTVTVTNRSPGVANDISLIDTLSTNVSIISVNSSQGTCTNSSGTISCVLGTIVGGGAATIAIQVNANSIGTATNSASATSSTLDLTLGNNSGSTTVTIADPAPIVTCPANIVAAADGGLCSKSNVTYTPTPYDNCPGVTASCTPPSGSTFVLGTTTVNCTATDSAGQMGGCSFTVTINDAEGPSLTCPDITTNSPANCTAVVSYTPTATDNCTGAVNIACSPASGSTFPQGSTTVNCVATDVAGNSNTCSFTVTVNVAVPTASTPPQNQSTPMGNSATFTVTAAGTPPFSYQWQLNGVPISGATAQSLTVSNVTLAQSGESYSVIISNCAGSVTSAAGVLTVTPIVGISFDFDSPGQFTNVPNALVVNDWLYTSVGTFVAGWPAVTFESANGGVGPAPGSGSLDLIPGNGSENTITLVPVTYDFSLPGKTLVASAMFKAKAPTSNSRSTQLGFVTTTSFGINDNNPQGFMTAILQSTAQPALTYELRFQHRRTDGGLAEVTAPAGRTPATAPTLVAGNWYKVTAAFVNTTDTAPNTFTIAATLQDMGATGTTAGAVLQSYPPNVVTNTSLVSQKTMMLALRGFENTGVENRDNIYAYATAGPVFFVQQPASQTVLHGRRATFRALVDGEGPYTYRWFRNGVLINGASSWKYITPPATSSDHTAQYTVEVTGATGGSTTSAPATLTVTPDPLDLVSAGSVDGCLVGVRFDQAVDPASVQNSTNFLINGIPATSAQFYLSPFGAQGRDGIFVLLTPTSPLSGSFTVKAEPGVRDVSGNPVGANNSITGMVTGYIGVDVNPAAARPPGASYSFGPGQFEITGGGEDIFTPPDSFRYVHTQKTGDFDVKVRVPAMGATRNSAKAGLHVRTSLDPVSPQVSITPLAPFPARNLIEATARSAFNGASATWGANITGISYPNVWVRLRRSGNTFLRYSSVNGTTWQFDGQLSQIMPPTVYFGLGVCAAVGAGAPGLSHTTLFEEYGDFAGYAGATIAITTPPVGSATVTAGGSTNLTVVATLTGGPAQGELSYVWQRSNGIGGFTNVPTAGATNNTFNTGALLGSDTGTQFRVVVRAPGAADVISTLTTVTVNDATAPTLISAVIPNQATRQVLLGFSEPVSAATALDIANYTVTNTAGTDMGVSSAEFLSGDLRTVLLTTTSALVAGNYGVRVSGVQDLGGNTITTTNRSLTQPGTPPTAAVVINFFGGLPSTNLAFNGMGINDLLTSPKFTNSTPDFIVYSNAFGLNHGVASFPNTLDNYGARIYSYFVPPTNGFYKFYIRADDFAQFYMNTNASGSTNPAGAVLQVQLTNNFQIYTNLANNHVTNFLNGGQRYYMELRYKETGGGDGGTVAIRAGNDAAIPPATEVLSSFLAYPEGVAPPTPIVVELYTGLVTLNSFAPNDFGDPFGGGGYPDLIDATNSLAFIARLPNFIAYEKFFGYCSNLSNTSIDNYLGRIYSYFIAPSNGLYKFYARSDDSSELWMNTNAVNSTDPAGMVKLGAITDFYDVNYRLMAENVPLIGGQPYYLEGRWREGTGGDGMTVSVRAQSSGPNFPPNNEIIPGSRFEFPTGIDRVGAVNLAVAPVNPSVSVGQTITFTARDISGAPPYGIIWLKNGVPVGGNVAIHVTQPLTLADNGAVYTVVLTNLFSRVERSTTVTVTSESTPPTLLGAVGSQYQNLVVLTYSEPLDPIAGPCVINYRINNGVAVLSASLDQTTGRRVTLRTTPQTPGTTYTVTVNGVRDAAQNQIAADSTASFTAWIAAGCGFYVEVFTNIPGTLVQALQADLNFVNNLPNTTYYTNRFGAGLFALDTGLNNYGVRVSGLFNPPSNGLYRFYVRGDDNSQLYMNTSGPDPSGRVLIARNDQANSGAFDNGLGGSASVALPLNAGTLYFMEALMKEGGGGDHLEVAMRPVDGTGAAIGGVPAVNHEQAMAGSYFVNVGNPQTANLTVAQTPPANLNVSANDLVTLSGSAYAPNFELSQASCYQWQRANGIGGFTNIPGAIGPSLSFFAAASDSQIRFIASAPGTNAVFTTTLNVAADNTGPFIVSANVFDGTRISVCFNEAITNSALTDQFNWLVNGDYPASIQVYPDPAALTATKALVTPLNPLGATFTIEATMTDMLGNPATSSTNGVVAPAYTAIDVGAPLAAGSSFSCRSGEIDVLAGGNDIWGNSDVGHLTMTPRSGNFDVRIRVQSLTRPDPIAKAGLMVRETLNADSKTMFLAVNPAQHQAPSAVNPSGLVGRDLGEAGQRNLTAGPTAAWEALLASTGPPSVPANSAYLPAAIPNAWIRIKREGNFFTAMRSYDGVNWLTYAAAPFFFQKTVFVGLATTAHTGTQVPGLVTAAEYRDVYIPAPPIILVQPSPPSQTVPLHTSVTYSVVASNPPPNVGPLTYQWLKNGDPIPGATNSSFNIPDATGADNGVYAVDVGNDGGVTTSVSVTLVANMAPVVNNDSLTATQDMAVSISGASLLSNDSDPEGAALGLIGVSGVPPASFVADFNSGVPAGSTTFGNGIVEANGGVNNSGVLKLTANANNQSGSFILNELTPGRRVTAFIASFNLRISDGTGEPADGFSFNFAPNLTIGTSTTAEDGVGTGFSFCVDNFRFQPFPTGGNANTSGLKIRYGGANVVGAPIPSTIADFNDRGAWNTARYVPVKITVTADGQATVLIDGNNVFGTVILPGYRPLTGRFGLYARTGGQNMATYVDNLSITTVLTIDTSREPSPTPNAPLLLGNALVDGGVLHLTDNIGSQQGSFVTPVINTEPLTGLTANFKVRVGGGTARPADGFSFCVAPDLSTNSWGEEGAGSYLIICFDTYDNNGTDTAPAIDVKYGGSGDANIIPNGVVSMAGQREGGRPAHTNILMDGSSQPVAIGTDPPAPANTPVFVPVSVHLDADGTLDLTYKGVVVFTNLPIPGFVPASHLRVGFGGRTGGANDNHWVDDLAVNITTASGTSSFTADFNSAILRYGTVVLSNNVVTYTPPTGSCGPDAFYYLVSDGQEGGISVGRVDVFIEEQTPAPPTITSCPTNRTLVCAGPLPDLRSELQAADNCCCVTITQNPPPGTLLGHNSMTTVTFTATDTGGRSNTCQAIVTVSAVAPAITTQPQSRTNNLGSTATFSVVVSDGVVPLAYQWFKDSSPLGGQTNDTLTLVNVQTFDAGGYNVVITDACSISVTSVTAALIINLPPVAVNDNIGAVKNTPRQIPAAQLLANDSDPNGDSITLTGVTSPSRAGGTVVLASGTITYTPPANFMAGDIFTYAVTDTLGASATGTVCVTVSSANLVYREPLGGWTYLYAGEAAAGQPRTANTFALDGTWRHSNGSDEWFGDGRGAGNGLPGGVSSNGTFITIEDAVTSTSGTTNNRKIFFTHDVRQNGVTASAWVDAGVTLAFRARLTPPDGLNEISLPNGYGIFSGGKGMFGVRQSSPGGMISFSLVQALEDFNPTTTTTNLTAGLIMNRLNGDAASGNVNSDTAAGGTTNIVALDPTLWHEFWINIQTNDATPGNGTHSVRVYVDGSTNAQVFNITAGNGNDNDTTIVPNWVDYLSMGLNNSPTLGAYDVDFYAFKAALLTPESLNDPEHPQLRIVRQDTNAVISWPQPCANFQLEQTASLSPTIVWSPVAEPVSTMGDRYQVTVSATTGNRFFRLRQIP